MNIYLVIKSKEELIRILRRLKMEGYLKDLDEESFNNYDYPMEFAIDLEKIFQWNGVRNPMFGMFRTKVDAGIRKAIISKFGA